jgi:hypothetical protein
VFRDLSQVIEDVRTRFTSSVQGNLAVLPWPASPAFVLDTYGGLQRRVVIDSDSALVSAVNRHVDALKTGSLVEIELRSVLQSLQQHVNAISGPAWPPKPAFLATVTQLWRFCGVPACAAKVRGVTINDFAL